MPRPMKKETKQRRIREQIEAIRIEALHIIGESVPGSYTDNYARNILSRTQHIEKLLREE